MISLGLSGLFGTEAEEFLPQVKRGFNHDSAAAIIRDGHVIAAIEEERLNRIKHCNLFPARAIQKCLDIAGVAAQQVESVDYFWDEWWIDFGLKVKDAQVRPFTWRPSREVLADRFVEATGYAIDPSIIHFRRHHESHAAASFHHSGFEDALVLVADGNGEKDSMSLYSAGQSGFTELATYPTEESLGHYYTAGTKHIGYELFDEYKLMGLAPYGNPARYRPLFEGLYELRESGAYALRAHDLTSAAILAGVAVRQPGEPFGQDQMDFAAGLQKSVERIILHILRHWSALGFESLCFTGGVAHNSTLNGVIARSGLFKRIFVHPASHDGGAAIGAALLGNRPAQAQKLAHVFLGSPIEVGHETLRIAETYGDLLEAQVLDQPAETAAELLAEGATLGWAAGRSEFGPRALGARSILADPRPAENKARVNRVIKNREGFRPFAPAALLEAAETHFELPSADTDLRFMGLTVQVKPESRDVLGATTHVDGSARLQIVDEHSPLYPVLQAFMRRSGIGVLLNTSFNNNAEPIVETAADCIRTFLTTGLDALIVNDILFTKRRLIGPSDLLEASVSLPPLVQCETTTSRLGTRNLLGYRDLPLERIEVSHAVVDALTCGRVENETVAIELLKLWTARLVELGIRVE